ncbi:replication initiation protein [Tortoise microvirus 104]|nr:replication initiation protein [Tortoise microvirus 6]QCS37451.1 replication initiation protein [Tortoise microvirus 104]
MACAYPVTVHLKSGLTIQTPCRHCHNCRSRKVNDLMFKAQVEAYYAYKKDKGCTFVTLTYADELIPANGSLCYDDFDKFNKRIKYYLKGIPYHYIACGEYGDSLGRPHYHVCFIGLDVGQIDKLIRKTWQYGLVQTGALRQGGLRYITKYMSKQISQKKWEELNPDLEKPFITASQRMAYDYIQENLEELSVNNWQYKKGSKLLPLPRYLVKKLKGQVDSLPALQNLQKEAQKSNENIYDYQRIIAFAKERMMQAQLRQQGQPQEPLVEPYHSVNTLGISTLATQILKD